MTALDEEREERFIRAIEAIGRSTKLDPKQTILMIGSSIGMTVAVMWTLLVYHETRPHRDSVSYREFSNYVERVDHRLDTLEMKIDRVLERVN
jgi:hypothetical protein